MLDIRDFGATGDGVHHDTAAINAAIARATQSGATIVIPEGRFLSFSIRLLSGITLRLDAGAVLEAADPARHGGIYDLPEDNPHDLYQDFGHSHWHNSLIWGENLEHVTICGPGHIDGAGLTREGPGSMWKRQSGEFPLSMRGLSAKVMAELSPEASTMQGLGNKAIALKNCRHVVLRDFSLARGGHFAVLATGCDDLDISNLTIDTNRDGLDIDGCRRVRIQGCRVNTPNDDAIVLKSSFALGERRSTEDVDIVDCHVSGFDPGTLLDGTFGRAQQLSPDQDRVTGRIKIGTESYGDFRRIHIRNCRFERSRGLALETVDGGIIEDVTVEDLTLSDVTTAPLFLRLGARLRGPDGAKPGAIRRIIIRNMTATDVLPDYSALLVGLPNHPIEDVTLDTVSFTYRGGFTGSPGTSDELADAYPEPSMFGPTPAYGLWARHVRGLSLTHVNLATDGPDARPNIILEDTRLQGA
ncbi:glycoside hydrolase family 28 protein [Asticcacaulis sp. 201]|uniref:rhamnogalacturonidase n=1 Tax=Asticcacaulis sp. 201 TaxID=3028787 RepID=UPI0029168298|nr:glycosyl hydrolase family 28-related protein [Asticcacaulis sp. 201]MDV6331258.1 glycosyl hydrolase family 28-related protein [Asticcacaulis sp. 201]